MKGPRTIPILENILVIAALSLLTFWYLYPGSLALFEGRTDTFMSDGTDPTVTSYMYDALMQVWKKHPTRFLYGSVYIDGIDPELGVAYVAPWNERWLTVLSAQIVPIEQVYTAIVFVLLVLNGLSMFWLTRLLNWNRGIGYGLTIAWAFNCFTRARAKVHGAMAGIYHLPLIFLALYLIVRRRSKSSLFIAALALFLAGTTVHYFLATCVFVSPFFLLFVVMQPEFREQWKVIGVRLTLAVLPLLIMLGLNFFYMVPSDAKITSREVKEFAVNQNGEDHPFLRIYYLHPIDLLGGDLMMDTSGYDLNPLRDRINRYIVAHLGQGNPHERSNGVRWSILILGLLTVFALATGKFRSDKILQRNILFFLFFGLFAFWLSCSPDFPFEGFGPSEWLHHLIPKIRVANRASIMTHFSLLMLAGYFLSTKTRWRRWLWLFPVLMIVDYLPLQKVPMTPIAPAFSELQREQGPCGTGMAFPYMNSNLGFDWFDMIHFAQRMRGSDCPQLNSMNNIKRAIWLTQKFPPTNDFLNFMKTSSVPADNLEKLVKCVPLNWIYFIEAVPTEWAINMCRRLGWSFNPDRTCVAAKKDQPLRTLPDECALY